MTNPPGMVVEVLTGPPPSSVGLGTAASALTSSDPLAALGSSSDPLAALSSLTDKVAGIIRRLRLVNRIDSVEARATL